jgi:rhodanese-related sulfurtransferase
MMTLHPGLRALPQLAGVPLAVLVALAGVLTGCGSSGTEAGGTESAETSGDEALPEAPRVTGAEARAMVAATAPCCWTSRRTRGPTARSSRAARTSRSASSTARMGELPRDRDIVVYCLGGGASPRAGARLRAAGYRAFVMGAKTNWDL